MTANGYMVLSLTWLIWFLIGGYFAKAEWPSYLYLLVVGPIGVLAVLFGFAMDWIKWIIDMIRWKRIMSRKEKYGQR